MFFTGFVFCMLRLFKLKTESKTIYKKRPYKITQFKLRLLLNQS